MGDRVLPSGKVYRQIFDAQVQLSRCLHASRRGRGPAGALLSGCLPAEGSADSGQQTNAHPAARDRDTANREQLSAEQRKRGREEQQDEADVRQLPDDIVSDRWSSDSMERLTEKKYTDHTKAVEQLHSDLAVLSKDYEHGYRQACGELLSCMSAEKQLEPLETLQELYAQWEAVREECVLRRKRIRALDQTLTGYESDRANMISVLLRKTSGELERIGFLLPPDINRLMDSEAMMINQALLANRDSLGRLILHLLEESLQKESLLRLCWEERLAEWRSHKINHIINTFKDLTCSDVVQSSSQQTIQEMRSAQQNLAQQRRDIIQQICVLVPPSVSRSLVSDWFSQLTQVNKKMDCVHMESMRQLHGCYEQRWKHCLTEVERCKEEVCALGLSEEEVNNIINSQLLNLIGRCQSQAEEQLSTLDHWFETLALRAGELSRSVYAVLWGAVLLWETHTATLEEREQHLEQHMDQITHTQQEEEQKKEAYLDVLLDKLRQESTEEALKSSLEKTMSYLEEHKACFIQRFGEECEVVECFPGLVLEELNTYSSALSRYYHLNYTYTLSPDTLCSIYPDTLRSIYPSINLYISGRDKIKKQRQTAKKQPISLQRNIPCSVLFPEAESSLVHLWDSGTTITFISSGGGAYSGPAFICPALETLDGLEEETQLSLFPTDLLTESLTRMRVLYFNHLEQRFRDVLSFTVTMVTGKKEVLRSEHDLRLQLHECRARRIETDIHNMRAAELVLHRDRVERHCKGVVQSLTSCQTDFLLLQEMVGKTTEDFRTKIYKMEDRFISATKSDVLVTLSSTLQASLDEHIAEIQRVQRCFRQSVQSRLDDLRNSNARLLQSFQLFSEGGNFTPKEVDFLRLRLEKVVKRIDVTEDSFQTDMEGAESKGLEQAKEIVSRFEEKFHLLTVDLEFLEKIQSVLTNTQVQVKVQVSQSNQQKLHISSRLEELKKMSDNTQITPDQVCSFLVSLSDDLRTRCRYLDCFLDSSVAAPVPHCPLQGSFALAARTKSRRQKHLATPTSLLQPCRMGVAFSDDAAVGVVKGLNKFSSTVCIPVAPADRMVSPGQEPQRQRSTDSVSRQGRRILKPGRVDRFQVFGPKPAQDSLSFKSVVASLLWKANDVLLLEAEEFYKQKESRAVMRPQFLANSFEQCAEELNKRLLRYQDQANQYYNTTLQEFRDQLCVLEKVVCVLPAVLFHNHRQQHVSALLEATDRIHLEQEEMLSASEDRKKEHVSQLRVRLGHPACEEELEALRSREEERQAQLHSAITRTYQELQECVCVGGAEFVTSLTSLTETLLFQMDDVMTVDQVISGETEASPVQRQHQLQSGDHIQRGSRTWAGVSYLSPPPDSLDRNTPSVTMTTSASSVTTATSPDIATTASITTAKTSLGHLVVIEQRDEALKVYEQVHRTPLCAAQTDRQNLLIQIHRWSQHWNKLTHTLTQLHTE